MKTRPSFSYFEMSGSSFYKWQITVISHSKSTIFATRFQNRNSAFSTQAVFVILVICTINSDCFLTRHSQFVLYNRRTLFSVRYEQNLCVYSVHFNLVINNSVPKRKFFFSRRPVTCSVPGQSLRNVLWTKWHICFLLSCYFTKSPCPSST